jgi:DNA-binding beta-propeller fold protein YncE
MNLQHGLSMILIMLAFGLYAGCAQFLGIEDLPALTNDASIPPADTGSNMAPVVAIVFPPANSLTDANTVTLRGTALDADGVATVRANGTPVSLIGSKGEWRATVPLMHGENEIVIESEDALGNRNARAEQIIVKQSANILSSPTGIDWDPIGKQILVTDLGLDALIAIDPGTGYRTTISGPGKGIGPQMLNPIDVTWDPINKRAIVLDTGLDALLAIELASGNRIVLSDATLGSGPSLTEATCLEWDPSTNNRVFVADATSDALLGVNVSSGVRTILSSAMVETGYPTGVTWDPVNNRALVVNQVPDSLVSINILNGERTVVSDSAVGTGPLLSAPDSVTWDPVSNRALVVNRYPSALVSIDVASGARTVLSDQMVGVGPLPDLPLSTVWDPVAARLLVLDRGRRALLEIDTATGNRTVLSDTAIGTGASLGHPVAVAGMPMRGGVLMIDSNSSDLLVIDLISGERATVPGDWFELVSLAWMPESNRALVVDTGYQGLSAVDPYTGTVTEIGEYLWEQEPRYARSTAIWDAGNNRVFISVADYSAYKDGVVVAVDLATSESTVLADESGLYGPRLEAPLGMAWDPERNRLLILDYFRQLVAIDLSTGEDNSLVDTLVLSDPVSMAWDATREQALVLDSQLGALIAVDVNTGEHTRLSDASTGAGPSLVGGSAMAWDADHRVALVSHDYLSALMAIDAETGERVLLSR